MKVLIELISLYVFIGFFDILEVCVMYSTMLVINRATKQGRIRPAIKAIYVEKDLQFMLTTARWFVLGCCGVCMLLIPIKIYVPNSTLLLMLVVLAVLVLTQELWQFITRNAINVLITVYIPILIKLIGGCTLLIIGIQILFS